MNVKTRNFVIAGIASLCLIGAAAGYVALTSDAAPRYFLGKNGVGYKTEKTPEGYVTTGKRFFGPCDDHDERRSVPCGRDLVRADHNSESSVFAEKDGPGGE